MQISSLPLLVSVISFMAPAFNPDRHFFPDLTFEVYTNICMANLILVSVGVQ